jgi:hypothetical protein
VTKPGIPWSPQEAAGVNEFLSSPLGTKWIGVLITRKPGLDLSSTERAALTGAFAAGYESVFGVIAGTRVALTGAPNVDRAPIDTTKD